MLIGLHLKYIMLETVSVMIVLFFFIQKLYFAPDVLFKKGESSIFRQDIGDTDVGVLVW